MVIATIKGLTFWPGLYSWVHCCARTANKIDDDDIAMR